MYTINECWENDNMDEIGIYVHSDICYCFKQYLFNFCNCIAVIAYADL